MWLLWATHHRALKLLSWRVMMGAGKKWSSLAEQFALQSWCILTPLQVRGWRSCTCSHLCTEGWHKSGPQMRPMQFYQVHCWSGPWMHSCKTLKMPSVIQTKKGKPICSYMHSKWWWVWQPRNIWSSVRCWQREPGLTIPPWRMCTSEDSPTRASRMSTLRPHYPPDWTSGRQSSTT